MKRTLLIVFILNLIMASWSFFIPSTAEAALVPCVMDDECEVCDLQVLAVNVVNTLIIIGTMVATFMFVYAGVLYVLSPASPQNIGKANGIFKSTLIGFVVILSAWLIVDIIMKFMYSGNNGLGAWNEILCQN